MTLYRIYAGRDGIDYHETSRELGFVEADDPELAREYALTLPGFDKPDNGYDKTSSSEGRLEEIKPFIATRDKLTAWCLLLEHQADLIEKREILQRQIDEMDNQIRAISL
jgi:hypothetical protein